MITALDHWAYDYMMEMLTPIMHLISKDTQSFLQGSYQGVPFVTMVIGVCHKTLEQEKLEAFTILPFTILVEVMMIGKPKQLQPC